MDSWDIGARRSVRTRGSVVVARAHNVIPPRRSFGEDDDDNDNIMLIKNTAVLIIFK